MASGDIEAACTGRALAQVLTGCWRPEPPPLELDAARLAELSPLLEGSGAGALAWRRLRNSAWHDHPGAALLHQAHMRQALDAQLQERKIEKILLLLHSHGIEPLLLKGWDCARLYPEPGLRLLGDVDLLVQPEQAAAISSLLSVPVDSAEGHELDIKTRLLPLYGLSVDRVMRGARRVPLRDSWARVPGEEDLLRLLCLHFLRHGAWRPLWLCDIAAALEARSSNFDWALCLGSDTLRIQYIVCALGLAHRLLGARISGTPIEERARRLPGWLLPAVLKQWETPMLIQHTARPLLASVPRVPGSLLHALRLRWPNPVEATIAAHMPLGVHPLPAQSAFFAGICLRFLGKQVDARRGQPRPPAS